MYVFTGASPSLATCWIAQQAKVLEMADVKCDGSSFAKAIVVKAPTDHAGVDAQRDYIAKHFGKWRSIGVKSVQHNKRMFDIMSFTTTDGKKHTLCFDITDYYGQL